MTAAKVALFDLDGTLCNYEQTIRRDLTKLASDTESVHIRWDTADLEELEKRAHIKARMEMIKNQPDWWFQLPEIEKGIETLLTAREIGFRIHVLTAGPRKNASAWAQKFRWYEEHVQSRVPEAKITITRDKSLVYGRVLVDDWPSYIDGWLRNRPRGVVIMPHRTYNEKMNHKQVFRMRDETTPEEVRSVLQAAFDRGTDE